MERIFSVPLKGGAVTDVYMLDSVDELSSVLSQYRSSLFISDDNASKLLYRKPSGSVIIKPGEREKRWESVERMLSGAASISLARDGVFIGFGGGVVLDLAAFASSVYMRGARLVLAPTTLLSMVDATLGGKTGFDYLGIKNLIGTFYPAEAVLIVPETLETLPEYEFRSGLGEVVKHALLSEDERLWEFLAASHDQIMAKDRRALSEMIRLSLEVKIWYITRDPEEKKGIRSALNLGHTFGHALESIKGFSISHGEGVAWGMHKALSAGLAFGLTPEDFAQRAFSLLSLYGFDGDYEVPDAEFPAFINAIRSDKKKSGGSVRFVLMEGQGKPVLTALDDNAVKAAVKGFN